MTLGFQTRPGKIRDKEDEMGKGWENEINMPFFWGHQKKESLQGGRKRDIKEGWKDGMRLERK